MTIQTNKSGLAPAGRAVLLKPYEPELGATMMIIPDAVKKRMQTLETRAIVIAIGPEAWATERHPRAAVGDKVLVAGYCGAIMNGPLDGEVYRMVNGDDVYARITGEAEQRVAPSGDFAAVRREKREVSNG
jgi:co-chaperonin GroES (HSP10)